MVTRTTTHPATARVGELRAFFADDHVHIALLVDHGVLLGAVERSDLAGKIDETEPALAFARLDGRTISPQAAARVVQMDMRRTGRRRLAVVSREAELLGLLCPKKDGSGFCPDRDVAARRSARM
jgi:hypothetical protein